MHEVWATCIKYGLVPRLLWNSFLCFWTTFFFECRATRPHKFACTRIIAEAALSLVSISNLGRERVENRTVKKELFKLILSQNLHENENAKWILILQFTFSEYCLSKWRWQKWILRTECFLGTLVPTHKVDFKHLRKQKTCSITGMLLLFRIYWVKRSNPKYSVFR